VHLGPIMTVRINCPHCSQAYNVPEDKLGKQTTCKKCNERFTLAQEAIPNSAEETPPIVEAETKPGGFFASIGNKLQEAKRHIGELHEKNMQGMKERMNDFAEANKRKREEQAAKAASGKYQHPPTPQMPSVKFITGPVDLKPNTGLYFDVHDGDLVLLKVRPGFNFQQECDVVLRIPLASVKHLEIETADRMSLGRVGAGLLLAGPLGAVFGGFGFKKKDRLLRIDFDDAGMEASIILGGGNVQSVNNKIMTARRDAVRAQQGASPSGT
jgi:predicted Zn finger-like uncharacterized protein